MFRRNLGEASTSYAEGKIASSVIDAVLEFCKTNGHRPDPESLLGKLYSAVYAYDHNRRYWEHNDNDAMYANKIHRVRAYPSYGREKFRNANRKISIRKAAEDAVGVERVFPRAKLIRVIFGEPEYQRIMAQKNDIAAKIFAEYFDKILNKKLDERDIRLLEMGVGIGVTSEMKSAEEKPAVTHKTASNKMGYFAQGLHPRDIAQYHNITEARVRQLQNKAIEKLQNNKELSLFFNLYQNGDVDGMLALLPEQEQRVYKFQQKNKMAEIPTDEANKVGEWLADNMRFHR
ncbi:MAG: hypothetical protein IJX89_02705 [Alphaproteobacteria bacterium]|nr:hypothetical protein [Alphaproteobacteria bacterium]